MNDANKPLGTILLKQVPAFVCRHLHRLFSDYDIHVSVTKIILDRWGFLKTTPVGSKWGTKFVRKCENDFKFVGRCKQSMGVNKITNLLGC